MDSPRKLDVFPRLVVVAVCLSILAGGLILTPPKTEIPYIQLGQVSIPHTCIFKNLTGLPCPGCGLSRSIVAAAHRDLTGSLSYHRLGLLTLFYIFLQLVHSLGLIVIPFWWARTFGYGKLLNQGIIVLGILFTLNWILYFL